MEVCNSANKTERTTMYGRIKESKEYCEMVGSNSEKNNTAKTTPEKTDKGLDG
jgi:hypothetical protein